MSTSLQAGGIEVADHLPQPGGGRHLPEWPAFRASIIVNPNSVGKLRTPLVFTATGSAMGARSAFGCGKHFHGQMGTMVTAPP